MATYDNRGNPILRFRLNAEFVKILSGISKGVISPDLVAKHLLIDHLIQRGLIPQNLIKEICDEMVLDYREIQKTYGLSNFEYDLFLKLILEKTKNAKK